MCVCVCVHVFICVCVCVFICVFVCAHLRMCVRVRVINPVSVSCCSLFFCLLCGELRGSRLEAWMKSHKSEVAIT